MDGRALERAVTDRLLATRELLRYQRHQVKSEMDLAMKNIAGTQHRSSLWINYVEVPRMWEPTLSYEIMQVRFDAQKLFTKQFASTVTTKITSYC